MWEWPTVLDIFGSNEKVGDIYCNLRKSLIY